MPIALGSDGTIYIGSVDMKLYAINLNGTKEMGMHNMRLYNIFLIFDNSNLIDSILLN